MKIDGKTQDIDIKSAIEDGEITICLDEQIGAIIHQHSIINFSFDEIENAEDMMKIMSKATQVSIDLYVPRGCAVYQYSICNDGEYEFSSHYELYSNKFFSKEEFEDMIQEAINDGRCDTNFKVLSWLETNKDFFNITHAQTVCVDRPWREEHNHLGDKFQILYR